MVSVIVSRRHDKIQVINEGLLDMTTQGLDWDKLIYKYLKNEWEGSGMNFA
jgi:hypothetical protein